MRRMEKDEGEYRPSGKGSGRDFTPFSPGTGMFRFPSVSRARCTSDRSAGNALCLACPCRVHHKARLSAGRVCLQRDAPIMRLVVFLRHRPADQNSPSAIPDIRDPTRGREVQWIGTARFGNKITATSASARKVKMRNSRKESSRSGPVAGGQMNRMTDIGQCATTKGGTGRIRP